MVIVRFLNQFISISVPQLFSCQPFGVGCIIDLELYIVVVGGPRVVRGEFDNRLYFAIFRLELGVVYMLRKVVIVVLQADVHTGAR